MNQIASDDEHANLFWTGGWDSTFQLLQLLTVYRQRVTPLYLIDAERLSTGLELRAMKRIKDCLFREHPYTKELLEPTRYTAVADVAPDAEITDAFKAIEKKKRIGSQYEWLAQFCRQYAMTDMQLCIKNTAGANRLLGQLVSQVYTGSRRTYRIDPEHRLDPEYVLFRYYSFPIWDLTKIQMAAIAEEQGWKDIMDMTWFCHHPTRDMKPCGRCHPCTSLIEDGLGWRIPASSRIASVFDRAIVHPMKERARRIVNEIGGVRS